MALNIKNREVESLVDEVARMTGESKTTAVLGALREKRDRLAAQRSRRAALDEVRAFLEEEVWSLPNVGNLPSDDDVLGFGPSGA